MREIVVIGSGGYIGARLMQRFAQYNVDWVRGFDLGIFGKKMLNTVVRDVSDMDQNVFADAVVIYLASFHREPDGMASVEKWRTAYHNLMVRAPLSITRGCHRLLYASSMRALTDTASLYGETKARAERALLGRKGALVYRFGTVWGGYDPKLPNRPNTAMNYALIHSKFTGDTWKAFTTHIEDVIDVLYEGAITAASPGTSPAGSVGGVLQNVVDTPVPVTADDIRDLLGGRHKDRVLQTLFRVERIGSSQVPGDALKEDTVAAQRLQQYYGLE